MDINPAWRPRRRVAREQPSTRVAVAAALLRKGHPPARVATLTEVPLALVELIAEHLPGNTPPHPVDANFTHPEQDLSRLEDTRAQRDLARCAAHQRRRVRMIYGLVLCLLANPAVAIIATVDHSVTLAKVVMILGPLTLLAPVLCTIIECRTNPRRGA